MKRIVESRKKSKRVFESICGEPWVAEEFEQVLKSGKKAIEKSFLFVIDSGLGIIQIRSGTASVRI